MNDVRAENIGKLERRVVFMVLLKKLVTDTEKIT